MESCVGKNSLIIIGAGGHGKVAADIAELCGYEEILFLDDDEEIKSCLDYPVCGRVCALEDYPDADVFVAIGDPEAREKLMQGLRRKNRKIVTLIHPNAVVAKDVTIGKGSVVMAGAVINPGSRIGDGCIVNTGATVDHDNEIGDYVHVSVGSHLAGNVTVGKRTWIGAGSVVSNNIDVCGDCMIGAGAAVVKDIREPGNYLGVPAKKHKPAGQ